MANASLGLDVGEKRIGVALADAGIKIAVPAKTINVDGTEIDTIKQIIADEGVQIIVVGYPRNQSGEATAQTAFVEEFCKKLDGGISIVFQDESLTSVLAEQRLATEGKPYEKGDIDALAAAMILQDYLETH